MKRFLFILSLLVLVSSNLGCSKVDPGHVGILVNMTGDSKGIDHEVKGVGWFFRYPTQTLYEFPTFQQNIVWSKSPHEGKPIDESMTCQDKDGLSINMDVGISFNLDAKKVPNLFAKYRMGIEEIAHTYLRNIVRDAMVMAASSKPVDSIYGKGKAAFMDEVTKHTQEQVLEYGIVVDKVYLIGDMRLPGQIIDALNAKMAATQKAEKVENELREAVAEAEKVKAKAKGDAEATMTRAKAEADANLVIAKSITPELIQYEKIKKWDGVQPKVVGGNTPLISMGDLK